MKDSRFTNIFSTSLCIPLEWQINTYSILIVFLWFVKLDDPTSRPPYQGLNNPRTRKWSGVRERIESPEWAPERRVRWRSNRERERESKTRQRDKKDDERQNDKRQRDRSDHLCSMLGTRVEREPSCSPSLSLSLLSLKRLVDIVSRIARARCWLNAAKTMPCMNDHDTQGTRLFRSSAFSFILHLGDFRLHVHIYMYIRLSHRPTSSSERGRIFFGEDRTCMCTNELDITRTRDTSFTSPTDSK